MLYWQKWFLKKKIEGDKKTPVGKYNLGKLFLGKTENLNHKLV